MFPAANVSTPNFLYRFPDNTQQYQFETGVPQDLSSTSEGTWGTLTINEMNNVVMPQLAISSSFDLTSLLGLPRGMGDSSSRRLTFKAVAGAITDTWDRVAIDISYLTPYGSLHQETVSITFASPLYTTKRVVYQVLSAKMRVPGATPDTFESNLVINKEQYGLTRMFQPDARNQSWEVSLQVMIGNIANRGTQTYTAWTNNCPTAVFNNATTMVPSTQITTYGGYADQVPDGDAPIQFPIGMTNETIASIVQIPFAVQNVWVEINNTPAAGQNVIYYVTLLQNGRWL